MPGKEKQKAGDFGEWKGTCISKRGPSFLSPGRRFHARALYFSREAGIKVSILITNMEIITIKT